MTIGQTLDNISREIKQCGTDLVNGTCVKNFKGMSDEKKIETALKVSAIAFAVGLTFGLLTGSSIVGVLFAGVAFVAAASYFTNNSQHGVAEKAADIVRNGMNKVKREVNNQLGKDNEVDKFVNGANNFLNDVSNDIQQAFQRKK